MDVLTKRLDTALDALQRGEGIADLPELLRGARNVLAARNEAVERAKMETTREAYALYRGFDKRLQEIGRAFMGARHPTLRSCYVEGWAFYDQHGPDERVALRIRYDVAPSDDEVDELGEEAAWGRGNRHSDLYLKASVLWLDDWKVDVELVALEEAERIAKRNLDGWNEALPKREADVVAAREKLNEAAKTFGVAEAKLEAFKRENGL